MMRELGRDLRFPGLPAPSKNAPIDAAIPKHTVATSHGMNCVRIALGETGRSDNILRKWITKHFTFQPLYTKNTVVNS